MNILRMLTGLLLISYFLFASLPSLANADEECDTFCKAAGEDYTSGRLAPNGDISKCDEEETGVDICCCS